MIFLNVVFGIIVDQFAELRDQRKEQANDMVRVLDIFFAHVFSVLLQKLYAVSNFLAIQAHCCPICGADVGESNNIDEESHFSQHVRFASLGYHYNAKV